MARHFKNSTKSNVQDFSKSVSASVPRSRFYRPSGLKTTFDAGKLVPIYIDEVLPGDTYEMKLQHVAKMITPLTPTMDNMELEFFAFFVPNRLVWDNWEKLMGENKDDAWTPPSTPVSVPMYNFDVVQTENSIGDYYGIPLNMSFVNHPVNILPFRGYGLIWNEWFRNQNVQAPLQVYTTDTNQAGALINPRGELLNVNKPFDYFTSCLPEPQKGDSQLIPIELNSLIPVITTSLEAMTGNQTPLKVYRASDGTAINNQYTLQSAPTGDNVGYADTDAAGTYQDNIYPRNLFADPTALGNIASSTISDLRTAFQIQKLLEKDARGGTRYVEILKTHFGVDARDYRLQRPEYLGHIKSFVGINQVPQTSETNTTPQGNLTAFAHSQGNSYFFNKSFVEHGFLHIFVVARQKKTYQQGLERFWFRQDRLDYYMPVLAHISEQPVYQKEIYALVNNPDVVFGYNEAWSDYRYKPSKTSAQMRSDNSNSFDIWHYADDYSSAPTLSDAWMKDNSNTNLERTVAISGTIHTIMMDVRFDLTCIRPMPVNSIPGYIDHF